MSDDDGRSVVLALNSGSSSLKFGLYRVGSAGPETLLSGDADAIGSDAGGLRVRDADGNAVLAEKMSLADPGGAVSAIAKALARFDMPPPDAVGHRIVHGGPRLTAHCLIDGPIMAQLEAAIVFAPLHVPPALSVIRAAQTHFASIPHIACLDTVFHVDLPPVARTLPLPRDLRDEGIVRYGFHGLSCESIVRQLAGDLPERLIVAHLGSGASITAIRNGKSIDTSMGLTPTGGVIMGTRTGDLDPGVLIYLMREKKLDATALEVLVDRRSGLAGISGVGGDMRTLHEAASSNDDARLAIGMFCYSVRKQIAAMIAALDGIDMIVFTGGIGENDAAIRAEICKGLSWAGVEGAGCAVRVLPALEDEQIARHSWSLTASSSASPPAKPRQHTVSD